MVGHPLNTIKTWQQATNSRIGTSIYEIIVRNNGVRYIVHLVYLHLLYLPLTLTFTSGTNVETN